MTLENRHMENSLRYILKTLEEIQLITFKVMTETLKNKAGIYEEYER